MSKLFGLFGPKVTIFERYNLYDYNEVLIYRKEKLRAFFQLPQIKAKVHLHFTF